MANTKFTRAVKKAKGLYKTGRYKRFSDAVKAAYKKIGKAGNDSSSGAGHTSTSTKAHTAGNKTATTTKTITAHVKVGSVGKAKTKFRQTGKSNKAADKKRTARRPGKRRSASGKTYYERRKNRSDVPFAMTGKKVNSIGNVLPKLTNKTVEWTLVKKFNTVFFDAGSYYITHRGELIFWSQTERVQARRWLTKNKTVYKK